MVLLSVWMHACTASHRFRNPEDAPARDTAIVLGASVHRKGKPSDMLRDRLDTALELYRAVYLARGLGIPAVGVEADRHRYRSSLQLGVREAFARVKAFLDMQGGRRPVITDPPVDIDGDGRVTWNRDRRRPASQPH